MIFLNKIKPLIYSKVFIVVLAIKIIFSFCFASAYMTEYFAPFINWFVKNGFNNPWEHFYSIHLLKMFPYPPLMLWLMSFPIAVVSLFYNFSIESISPLNLFFLRVPLLISDFVILVTLYKLLPGKKEMVLYAYWCSPIVFFINYIHGQLDIIPTQFFLLSIYFLTNKKYFSSSILLALAALSKSHIIIFLPFYFVFLYKQRIGLIEVLKYLSLFFVLYFIGLFPYINSEAFINMVFKAEEQGRIHEFILPISKSSNIIVSPVVLFLLFTKFVSYRKLNNEILLMFTGIVFAFLIMFVNPMPGWFMWSLPFLIYFYVHNDQYSKAPFFIYNLIYIIYYLLFFEKNIPLDFIYDRSVLSNFSLSLLIGSVGFSTVWMYQVGIKRNEEVQLLNKSFLIGIGGDSSSGKHTLCEVLENLLGKEKSVVLFGDNFHKWERGNKNWDSFTHLNPKANKLYQSRESILSLKNGEDIEIVEYDHKTGNFIHPKLIKSNKFIFFVGLHPFYLKNMRELMDLKVFIENDEELRKYWKVKRDTSVRGHKESDVLKQISIRKDDGEKYIKPQRDFADLVISYTPIRDLISCPPNENEIYFKAKYIFDNSIEVDKLIELLSNSKMLEVQHFHSYDVNHQELEVFGSISSLEISIIANKLKFDFNELLIQPDNFYDNYNGITQLVFLSIYNHKMRANKYGR